MIIRGLVQEAAYLLRAVRRPLASGTRKYAVRGVTQTAIDLAAFFALRAAGASIVTSHISSFLLAAVLAPLIGSTAIAVRRSQPSGGDSRESSAISYLIIVALTLFLRGGLLALLMQVWALTLAAAIIPAATISTMVVLTGKHVAGIAGWDGARWERRRWHVLSMLLVAYTVILRIVYIPTPNLIPEEAYYWNYAQHLDWGYLDHPPMVAWIIKLGTLAFGNTEFGVRIGAIICWLAMAVFAYQFARELLGRRTAVGVLLLLSTLPFFFGLGCLLTPDAPLAACWAGALFFLQRALLRGRPAAWLGAGICIGVGLLSKYTIGLLVPAAFLFVLIDSGSRRWLTRPQPYLACLIVAVLFSPVIYWNATHEWASFVFQTSRRLSETGRFSLHVLLGEIMLLLTPTVLAGALTVLLARGRLGARLAGTAFDQRAQLFLLCFTLVPLAVFTTFSITHEPKLNWTGPTWLVLLPLLAWVMAPSQGVRCGGVIAGIRKLWTPTLIVSMLFLAGMFHFLALGLPVVRYPAHTMDIAGWRDLQGQIAQVENSVRERTGVQPLIAGLDRYTISSELAYYGAPDGPNHTAGRHLFGQNGLMYRYWFPASEQAGRVIILVDRERGPMESSEMAQYFDSLSQTVALPVSLNGVAIGEYYYRVAFGYRPLTTGP